MAQALYRKWRSQTFEEIIGQDHVTQTLRNALLDDRVAHAYLFAGPRGTGKTSTARILAKAINCNAEGNRPCNQCTVCSAITSGRMIDLIEIDAASNNSVDDIRELRDKVGFRPSEGKFKIYIIDEVHMLSTAAFNALLKTLEEPPPHVRFVLATTEPHRIPATVQSRCQRLDFRRISVQEIANHLHTIVVAEGYEAEHEALLAIGRSAQGCMRDAISLLDQMFSYGTQRVTLKQVQEVLGTVNAESVAEFVDAVLDHEVSAGLSLIHRLLSEGVSLTEFCHQVIEHLRGVLVLLMTQNQELLNEIAAETVDRMAAQAARTTQSALLFAVRRFSEAIPDLKGGYQPQLPLEMALIEAIQGPPAAALAAQAASGTASNEQTAWTGNSPPASTRKAKKSAEKTAQAAVGGESAAAPQPDSSVEIDVDAVEKLRTQFNLFKSQVREACGHQVQAALNTVRDIAVAEGTVVFAFGNNSFTRDMIMQPEIHGALSKILSGFLGSSVVLECQTGEKANLSGLLRHSTGKPTDEGSDPLVEFAVNELGAKVIE